jgi:hypothetical protein
MLDHLAFWYQVIIASEPLLIDAICMLDEKGWEGDLRIFFEKHLEDESNHAQWLKEDLGDHPINLHYGATQLAGMAYYLVRHVHPVALLGYMMALEGHPIPMEYVEAVEKEHGVSTARTLRLHAEEDPHHFEELKAVFVPDEWKPLVENTRIQTRKLIEGLA